VRRNFLLIATLLAAAAFLGWLVWVTPGESPAAHTAAGAPTPPPAAVVASGSAGVPADAPPESRPAQAPQPDPATPTAAPPEVQEATDRRQAAKITRGMSSNPEGGIRIDEVLPGSVAGQMNLLPGDVLVAVDGTPVASLEQFAQTYRTQGIQGEYVVIRGGREIHRR
jgi:membrane-associated protease RseP (regulator of RpoE activity)